MTGARVLTLDKELHKLPIGAVVVNGHPGDKEYVFAKVSGNLWKIILLDKPDKDFHKVLTQGHPEWGAKDGFRELNLPVYLLSKTGNAKEVLDSINKWREGK